MGGFAALVPTLVPALCDRGLYETRLLNSNAALDDRVAALLVLASVGADLGGIYQRLQATEGNSQTIKGLELCFVMACGHAPFAEAIPLLEERMKSVDENSVHIILSALMKLGELPGPAATAMLMRALSDTNKRIRQCASVTLSQRRSRKALASLLDQYGKEDDEALALSLATAIVASGPRSVADIQSDRHDTPALQLWQCILAMRLRDVTMADQLVAIASDPAQNWQLRRAAIFAAGCLPYGVALDRIVPVVMSERSPLTIDRNSNFLCHEIMSSFLLCDPQGLASIFVRGRTRFVEFFDSVFEDSWNSSMSREGLPSGAEAAGWLFDRPTHHRWPTKTEAPDRVLNELHIPILHSAVLRSLRLSGQPELIERQLPQAYHVWFAMKCLMERARAGKRDPELNSRLKSLVELSACKGSALLNCVIDEIAVTAPTTPASAPPAVAKQEATAQPVSHLSYHDAVLGLSGANPDFKPTKPLVLELITKEQFEHLVRLAEPANDHYRSTETYLPLVSFTPNGHTVAQRRVTMTNGGETSGTFIRPAIAAANRFGVNIPWHQELLAGVFAATYVPRFLACLAAQNDSSKFYEDLAEKADLLLPEICKPANAAPISKYIDARIVPILSSYVSSGTDEFFEGLCTLALQVTTPEIDPVLAGLLHRWTQRFDIRSVFSQHDQNHTLWRGFAQLAEHPRFTMIEGWRSKLASVLQGTIAWYHSQSIVRVLERDPRSYILIEFIVQGDELAPLPSR